MYVAVAGPIDLGSAPDLDDLSGGDRYVLAPDIDDISLRTGVHGWLGYDRWI
jgi:hypothetical protein